MAEPQKSLEEMMRRAAVEKMILQYYNDTLLRQGVISESQHHKMQVSIASRKPPRDR